MYGYIYLTTNLINGKMYIGQKKSTKYLPNYLGSGKILRRALKKYGIENFINEVLKWCDSKEELNLLEKFYIKIFNASTSDYFYNIAKGGDGGMTHEPYYGRAYFKGRHHTEESKQLMREKRIGRLNPMWGKRGELCPNYGRQVSEETRQKIREKNSGENHPNWGKHLKEETRNKISSKITGITRSKESNIKNAKAHQKWPDEVILDVAKMRNSGVSYQKIQEKYPDIPSSVIEGIVNGHSFSWLTGIEPKEIKPLKQSRITKEVAIHIVELSNNGLTPKEIAEKLSIPNNRVYAVLEGRCWSKATGIKHKPQRRFTNEELLKITQLHQEGVSNKDIASMLNSVPSTISGVVNGRYYSIGGKNEES